jgi:hypothetical protein
MHAVPLIAHGAPDDVVAYRRGSPIRAARFIADAAHLAAALPATGHVLNACQDRYCFAVGLAACIISNRVSLLPSTHTPEAIRQLGRFAPDAICLSDDAACDIALPQFRFPQGATPGAQVWQVPSIAANQLVAYVFTSGSTGVPVPHAKTWGRLVRCVQIEADAGVHAYGSPAIVATSTAATRSVSSRPCSCRYQSGRGVASARSTPADIASALAAAPAPRMLVSTPVHLRTRCHQRWTCRDRIDSLGHGTSTRRWRAGRDPLCRAAAGDLRLHRDGPDRQPAHDADG